MIAWHLQLVSASIMELDQQLQPLLKWLRGRTKASTNSINLPCIVKLADTTLQDCLQLLKNTLLPPSNAWHLQSERASMRKLGQQVQTFLKRLWGMTKYHANRINALKIVYLSDTTLQTCQELLKSPFLSPTSD